MTITVSDPLITEGDVGLGKFKVIATFSEAMDTAFTPTVSFTPAVGTTLTFSGGVWSVGDTVYTATYDVADGNVEQADVDVSVSGAKDVAGNTQSPNPTTTADLFDIDTIAPTVNATKTYDLINDADGNGVASPGDTIGYTIAITNAGTIAANNVTLDDTPDANTTLVVGSVTTTQGSVILGNNPGDTSVRVSLGNIPSQSTVQVSYQVTINKPLYDVNVIVNQGVIKGDNILSVKSDDPDTPQPDDPTVIEIETPLLPPGVPSVSQWGGVMLSMLFGILMVWMIRRRQIRSVRWIPLLGQDRGNVKSGSRCPQGIRC